MRYGTTEVFFVPLSEQTPDTCYVDNGEPVGEGWFYWECFPGCLPEGDPNWPLRL